MANDLNRSEFIGRLGKEPELRYAPSGDAVCNFTIAVGWKSKEKEGAEWVRCTAFGKLADVCGKYLKKGSQVYISGRFTTRKWKNKEGVDQYFTEINVDQMQMLGGKSESDAPPVVRQAAEIDDIDSDLPF